MRVTQPVARRTRLRRWHGATHQGVFVKRSFLSMAALAAFAVAVVVPGAGGSAAPSPAAPRPTGQQASVDTSSALVQLAGDPLSVSPRTKPGKGAKIDFASNAVKNERAVLAKTRNEFRAWLKANAPQARITNE